MSAQLPQPQQPMERQIEALFARHKDSLASLSSAELHATAKLFRSQNSANSGSYRGSACKHLCIWAGRLLLCLLAAAVAVSVLTRELVAGGYATQSTEWLAALDLAGQKLVRRVAHAFRIYDSELVLGSHGSCLLANPFAGQPPPLCCGSNSCQPARVSRVRVTSGNLTAATQLIDSLYNRVVSPFLVIGPPAHPVDFARLAAFVAENREEFRRGANQVLEVLDAAASPPATLRFDDIFPKTPGELWTPAPGQMVLWSFHHLPAVRALRRLAPRPAFFGLRTERLQDTTLLIAGRRSSGGSGGGGDFRSIGDFAGLRALAYAMSLNGRLAVRLAPKSACCGAAEAATAATAENNRYPTVTLEPGRVLFFPTDCHNLLVSQQQLGEVEGEDDGGGGALLIFGFVYNGAHQAKKKNL